MNVIMLKKDGKALSTAGELFGYYTELPATRKIVTWAISAGGPKTVAIYSLAKKEMFIEARGGNVAGQDSPKALISIFETKDMDPKRGEVAEWGRSIKEWNKASRRRLTPKELQHADIFLVVNKDGDPRYVQIESIKAQIISMSKADLPKGTAERAGNLAFSALPQNRVIYPNSKAPSRAKCVWYGTSGATNIAELLLTMAAGHKLGLPVRFDNYGETARDTAQGQKAMKEFASELTKAVGIKLSIKLLSTASEILEKVRMPVSQIARELEWTLGHPVGLCQHNQHGSVKTNDYSWLDRKGQRTVKQLHREGYRFGGAPIYWAFYSQAATHDFVAILYDGSKGGVHQLARPWMTDPHGLWICPAGSFTIKPRSASSMYEVADPEKFLQALKRSDKKEQILNWLWELALERVPLDPAKVGSKIAVEIYEDGSIAVT